MPMGQFMFLIVVMYLVSSISMFFFTIFWASNTLIEEQGFIKGNASKIFDVDHLGVEAYWIDAVTGSLESKNPVSNTDHVAEKVKNSTTGLPNVQHGKSYIAKSIQAGNHSLSYGIFCLILNQPIGFALAVNAAYCTLVIFMCFIQYIVFGIVRPLERQHMKGKLWNFIFYKLIFIFGVLNVQSLKEVFFWVSWFTAILCLLLLTKLSKVRFKFLSFSPNTPTYHLWKVVVLLHFILLCCILLIISSITMPCPISFSSTYEYEIHSIMFMLAESLLVTTKALRVLIRYGIHLHDIRLAELWEMKSTVIFYVDLILDSFSLSVNCIHHVHMLFSSSIWLSMASLVICMQLRFIFAGMRIRYLRYRNYRRVVANMDARYPTATREEIDDHEDRCAICWDHMETARKLPCGHLFHAPCLRSWLQQDTTCPTCRKKLDLNHNPQPKVQEDNDDDADGRVRAAIGEGRPGRSNSRQLYFTTLLSWLPSYSFEFSRFRQASQDMEVTMRRSNIPNSSDS